MIVEDLAKSSRESLYLPLVALLPPHVRLEMFDTAALWHPLREEAIRELLREEDDWDEEEEEEGDGVEAAPSTIATRGSSSDSDAASTRSSPSTSAWELAFHDTLSPSLATSLTTLNLSFSPISLRFLRSLLLRETPTRPLPSFPNLSTLLLAATPNLPFLPSFFDTLKPLISLRHLSVAGKSFEGSSGVPPAFLSRLAVATPTLFVVDLSFLPIPGMDKLVGEVDWDLRWREVRKLGLRRNVRKGGEEGDTEVGRKERARKLWTAIAQEGRTKPRPWIDIIT